MPRLFAEAYLEPLEEASRPDLPARYDEGAAMHLLVDGTPAVERRPGGETVTITKVDGERDDQGAAQAPTGGWSATRKDTETVTLVESEGIDWAPQPDLDTLTRVKGETDDWST